MKARYILFALAATLVMAACHKEDDPTNTPSGNGNAKNCFSISSSKKVEIATGNLQYQASTKTWRIAPNAWDAAGEDNLYASATFSGWIDYFGFGASGFDGIEPYTVTGTASSYYTGGDLTGTEYDWGKHNAIQNGNSTDPAGTWRTLSDSEWEYIINLRKGSSLNTVDNARYACANVNGTKGLILFPDQYQQPAGVPSPAASSINTPADYDKNQYSSNEWTKMEEAGCVFLPAGGCHNVAGNTLVSFNFLGCYWTSNFIGEADGLIRAGQLWFSSGLCEIASAGVQYGRCVRLAKETK